MLPLIAHPDSSAIHAAEKNRRLLHIDGHHKKFKENMTKYTFMSFCIVCFSASIRTLRDKRIRGGNSMKQKYWEMANTSKINYDDGKRW